MQIDFHHTVTYTVARLAGFDHAPAEVIAHAAQYVDDSTETGLVHFDNAMRYFRKATAHPVLDPANIDNDNDAESWLPFHFLPGNDGLPAEETPQGPYLNRLICRPGSHVAAMMVQYALADKGKPWQLHRLGIAAHVLADTWAHQGFVGLDHPINGASDFQDAAGTPIPVAPLPLPPVGHGQARTFPDMPYLVWSYADSTGRRTDRNNPEDFVTAAGALHAMFRRWLGAAPADLSAADAAVIRTLFTSLVDEDGKVRHRGWLDALSQGTFSFGKVSLAYDPDEWKEDALGRSYERKLLELVDAPLPYDPQFQASNWKLFHDAARCQRHDVFTHILPAFGIMEH